jgi:hypothetical protein
MPLIWRERSTAEFPMMSFLSISFSASAAGRAFISRGAYNKMSSSEIHSVYMTGFNIAYNFCDILAAFYYITTFTT